MEIVSPSSVQVERRSEHLGVKALLRDNLVNHLVLLLMGMATYWLQMETTITFKSSQHAGGKFLTAVGQRGNKHLEFSNPVGVTINHRNRKVYICDRSNHRIQILNADLTFSSSFGNRGRQFTYPWDVAFDCTGNVYLTDSGGCCIQVFTAEGKFLRKFGKKGSDDGELNFPSSISIDSDNIVYVTEYYNHRVSMFTSEGQFLRSFGTKGEGPGQFIVPCGIAVDRNGLVHVSDRDNSRIQIFQDDVICWQYCVLLTCCA